GGPRPGAVALGKQFEFRAAYVERDIAALLEREAFDKAHDIGDLLARPVGHHCQRMLALPTRGLAFARLPSEVAHLAGLILVGIGRPGVSGAEALRRRRR